jgi:hypothetical protein
MKTFIQRQEACIARMLESRTSERRAAKNRAAAIAQLRKGMTAAGYSEAEIKQAIADVRAMYQLEVNAE